jgi:hypothetical protein
LSFMANSEHNDPLDTNEDMRYMSAVQASEDLT